MRLRQVEQLKCEDRSKNNAWARPPKQKPVRQFPRKSYEQRHALPTHSFLSKLSFVRASSFQRSPSSPGRGTLERIHCSKSLTQTYQLARTPVQRPGGSTRTRMYHPCRRHRIRSLQDKRRGQRCHQRLGAPWANPRKGKANKSEGDAAASQKTPNTDSVSKPHEPSRLAELQQRETQSAIETVPMADGKSLNWM